MENFNEQTTIQVDRFLRKVIQKFTSDKEPSVFTDIHVRISPESGDVMAFDDDDNEITRCVVEEWINSPLEDFYDSATVLLRNRINEMSEAVEGISLLKPFSFVLEDEDKEHVAELYVSGDDVNIIGGDIMAGWDKDLDSFFEMLMKD